MIERSLKYALILAFLLILSSKSAFSKEVSIRIWDISHGDEESIDYRKIKVDGKNLTPENILGIIFKGERIPEILIIKNETAYLNIPKNPEDITNRSGSTGALHFQAKAVFNLTEFPYIKYVYFVDEGEHFVSGKYERLNFWHLLKPEMKKAYKAEIEKRLNPKSTKTAYYVYLLTQIGDSDSIKALEKLRQNYKRLGFECISIDIEGAVNTIRKRLK